MMVVLCHSFRHLVRNNSESSLQPPTACSRLKRVPRSYKTKVQHAESAGACDVINMKMMDCLALETLVVNHELIELIDVRSRKEFAAMHIRGRARFPLVSWRRRGFFEGGARQRSAFMSFPPTVTLEPALQRGFCDRPAA